MSVHSKTTLMFILGSLIMPVLCSAQDNIVKAGGAPVNVSTNTENPNEIRGKEAVISRLEKLFSNSDNAVELSKVAYQATPPQMEIIKGSNDFVTLVYTFRYIKSEVATEALDALVSDDGIVEGIKKGMEDNPSQNIVMVRDKAERIEEIKNFLLAIDKPQPQVLVETQIIEVYIEQGAQRDMSLTYSHTDGKTGTTSKYGFNMDSPGQNNDPTQGSMLDFFPVASNSSDGGNDTLNIAMRLLNTSSDARILSAPNIIADQGVEAKIETGEDLPIPSSQTTNSSTNLSFEYKRVGVSLKIIPVIINENSVQLEVEPGVSSAIRYQTFIQEKTSSIIPVISVRNIKTRLTVRNGDIVVLGGLYSSENNEMLRKIPYISDIPILGDLFTGRDTQIYDKQLLFFMKVHILPVPTSVMLDPEKVAKQAQKTADALKDSDQLYPAKEPVDRFDMESGMKSEAKKEIEDRLIKRREALEKEQAEKTGEANQAQ